MTTVIKYVGNGEFINGLPARDLTDEDWVVIRMQGRQKEVLESPLYQVVGPVPLAEEPEEATRSQAMPAISDDVDAILKAAGYTTVSAVNRATDDELLRLAGIGPKKLKGIRTVAAQASASDVVRESDSRLVE